MVKRWRDSTGYNQAEFGKWLGVSRTTVNRWEGGLQAIPKMAALLHLYGAMPTDIYQKR